MNPESHSYLAWVDPSEMEADQGTFDVRVLHNCTDHNDAAFRLFHGIITRYCNLYQKFTLTKNRIAVKVQEIKGGVPQEEPQVRHILINGHHIEVEENM